MVIVMVSKLNQSAVVQALVPGACGGKNIRIK